MPFNEYGMPQQAQQMAQKPSQVGNKAPAPAFNPNAGIAGPQTFSQPQQGGYDLEAMRSALGFGKVDFSQTGGVQGWLSANPNIASGVTVKNDKLYDPSGKYIADAVSNFKSGGTTSQFLDGIGSNGKPYTPKPGGAGAGAGAAAGAVGGGVGTTIYKPGALPKAGLNVYQPGQIDQYQNINQDQTQGMVMQALQQALSGGSLSPEVVAQMQGQLKDQALTMQQGQDQQVRQSFANRGMATGAGAMDALLAGNRQNTQSNLLNQYRDLNVAAAGQNRQDLLNALGAAESAMGGQVARGVQQFNTGLQGQLGQEGLNQSGIMSQNAAVQFELQKALEAEGLKQAAAGLGLQGNAQNLQNKQFYAGLGQQANQFAQTLGYQYTNLNAQNDWMQQQALLKALGLA